MPAVRADVERRLRDLHLTTQTPADEIQAMIEAALKELPVRVLSVSRGVDGSFTTLWRREQGVLTEETTMPPRIED